jgi:hypothetical protein
MSNNDGADFARSISAGEELSRLMVEAEYLREENKRLREALAVIYKAADKERNECDEYWWVNNHTTVQSYICSVLGAPPEAALGEGKE